MGSSKAVHKQTFTFYEKERIIAQATEHTRPVFMVWFNACYPNASEESVSEKQLAIWKIKVRAARRTDRMNLRALRNMYHTPQEIKELEDLIANFPYVNKGPRVPFLPSDSISTDIESLPITVESPIDEPSTLEIRPLFAPGSFVSEGHHPIYDQIHAKKALKKYKWDMRIVFAVTMVALIIFLLAR